MNEIRKALVEHNHRIVTSAKSIEQIDLANLIDVLEFMRRLEAGEKLKDLVANPPRNEYTQ